jgi:hypothetical protein
MQDLKEKINDWLYKDSGQKAVLTCKPKRSPSDYDQII